MEDHVEYDLRQPARWPCGGLWPFACAVGGQCVGCGGSAGAIGWEGEWPGVRPRGHFSARTGAAPRPSPYLPLARRSAGESGRTIGIPL